MELIRTYPDILNTGAVDLINAQCLHQSDFIKKKRLDGYSFLKVNGVNIDQPVEAISTCAFNPVELEISGNATLAEIEYNDEFGTVFSVQLLNESRQGTTAGAHLGASLAQASYMDNTSPSSYKAKDLLAAGPAYCAHFSSGVTKRIRAKLTKLALILCYLQLRAVFFQTLSGAFIDCV